MHRLAFLGATLALGAALMLPSSAAATTCVPIEMQLRDLPASSVVFVGTVLSRDATAVQVRVDQWYAGTDPRNAFLIPTAAPGEPIIIGTWEPQPGQEWFIVGERIAPDRVDSGVCRQMPVEANLLATATAIFGPPEVGPFEEPAEASGSATSGVPLVLWAGLIGLGAIAGVGAVLLAQRRAEHPPD